MRGRSVAGEQAAFAEAIASLHAARVRPEIRLAEAPAPQRVAPAAVALTAEVFPVAGAENELATGRFVLLHDPSRPEPWEGAWRIVTFARAELEPEVAADPVFAGVGWAWLLDALQGRSVTFRAEAGTVTRVVSESFGTLADRAASVDLEIRASWSPSGTGNAAEIGAHLLAWTDLLCMIAGLPPLPDGVVALPGARR